MTANEIANKIEAFISKIGKIDHGQIGIVIHFRDGKKVMVEETFRRTEKEVENG